MSEKIQQAIYEYLESVEAATKQLKQQISNQQTNETISENIFFALNFEQREGTRLGEYEIAQEIANQNEAWNKAISILKNSQSTISSRYHEEGYIHSYWLYGENHDRIYRQKLKQPNEVNR